jgi:hypothetical protein
MEMLLGQASRKSLGLTLESPEKPADLLEVYASRQ